MCIIFYNEVGKAYDRDEISVAYDNNPHGVGLMWVEEGRVRTIRGLFTKEKLFSILDHFKGVPHVLHLRWRTRGDITKSLCHPFRASHKEAEQSVYMMHNGTFFGMHASKGDSDTAAFAQNMQAISAEFGTDMLFYESFLRKLEKQIESYNKVIFLRDDGKVAILNPEEWTVKNGVWYSNVYSLGAGYRKAQEAKTVWNKYVSVTAKDEKNSSTQPSVTSAKRVPVGGSDWLAKSQAWEESRRQNKKAAEERRSMRSDERRAMTQKRLEEMGRSVKDRDGNKSADDKRSTVANRRVIRRRHNPDGGYIETVIRPRD